MPKLFHRVCTFCVLSLCTDQARYREQEAEYFYYPVLKIMLKRTPISPSFVQEIGQETSAQNNCSIAVKRSGKEQDKTQNK